MISDLERIEILRMALTEALAKEPEVAITSITTGGDEVEIDVIVLGENAHDLRLGRYRMILVEEYT